MFFVWYFQKKTENLVLKDLGNFVLRKFFWFDAICAICAHVTGGISLLERRISHRSLACDLCRSCAGSMRSVPIRADLTEILEDLLLGKILLEEWV